MLKNIKWLGHSTIKFEHMGKIIYVDPYKIKENFLDADIIYITHNHYDHFSKEDILKIKKDNTFIVITEDIYDKVIQLGFNKEKILSVIPNKEYEIEGIKFSTVYAYNVNKEFHPKANNWVGYIILLDGIRYYIAGDTDKTLENEQVKCDVAFLPVGGTYTMNAREAVKLAISINPKIVVPIHYGTLVGTIEDARYFKEQLKDKVECIIMKEL